MIKTVFFGTHNFATTILEGLLNNPFFEIVGVITQPDRPVGRKQELQASPVKLLALERRLEVLQPESLKNYQLPFTNYQLQIVAQYGLLIPKNIIEAPKYKTINVHTSLLPKYRGASPIQSALLHGDTQTGVTIMLMDEGMDSGPILMQKQISILPDETYLELDERMSHVGVDLLNESIPKYISGDLQAQVQDETQVSYCKKLSRDDGKIDWNRSTQDIYNQYRGLSPWPGIWTIWDNKRLKLIRIQTSEKKLEPGRVYVEHEALYIGTQDSAIQVLELQLEGKALMSTKDFLSGYKTHIQNFHF